MSESAAEHRYDWQDGDIEILRMPDGWDEDEKDEDE